MQRRLLSTDIREHLLKDIKHRFVCTEVIATNLHRLKRQGLDEQVSLGLNKLDHLQAIMEHTTTASSTQGSKSGKRDDSMDVHYGSSTSTSDKSFDVYET